MNIMELLSQFNLFDGSVQWLLHFGNCTPLEAHCHNLGDHFHNETALPRSYEVEPLVNSRPFEGLEHRILHSPAFASIESQDLQQERGGTQGKQSGKQLNNSQIAMQVLQPNVFETLVCKHLCTVSAHGNPTLHIACFTQYACILTFHLPVHEVPKKFWEVLPIKSSQVIPSHRMLKAFQFSCPCACHRRLSQGLLGAARQSAECRLRCRCFASNLGSWKVVHQVVTILRILLAEEKYIFTRKQSGSIRWFRKHNESYVKAYFDSADNSSNYWNLTHFSASWDQMKLGPLQLRLILQWHVWHVQRRMSHLGLGRHQAPGLEDVTKVVKVSHWEVLRADESHNESKNEPNKYATVSNRFYRSWWGNEE